MRKFLALAFATVLLTVSSSSGVHASELVDSVGGTAENPYGGKDVTQNKETVYDDENVTDSEYSSTSEIKVYATKASRVSYKIPQTLVGGSNGTAVYKVGVKGDISATQRVTISAPSSFVLTDGTRNVTATITQDKKTWVYSDLVGSNLVDGYSMGTGTIKYTIPAGSFSGAFNFNIAITNSSN